MPFHPENDVVNLVQMLRTSPIVFLGIPGRYQEVGKEVAIADWDGRARLSKLEVHVETILRGQVKHSDLNVTCHAWTGGGWPKGRPVRHSPTTGPSLFFIRHIDDNVAFCAQDLYTSSYPVVCSLVVKPASKTVELAVADALLGSGTNCDIHRLESQMYIGSAIDSVNALLGWIEVAKRLDDIVQRSTGAAKKNVCIVEAQFVLGHDACLDTLSVDRTLDESETSEVARLRNQRSAQSHEIIEWLHTDPVRWVSGRTSSEPWRQVDFLNLLLQHPNVEIRTLAFEVLKKYYPG
jgi:hypothetical protein